MTETITTSKLDGDSHPDDGNFFEPVRTSTANIHGHGSSRWESARASFMDFADSTLFVGIIGASYLFETARRIPSAVRQLGEEIMVLASEPPHE